MRKHSKLTLHELLVLLMEECAEVAQAASKCLRFGICAKGPRGYGFNDKALARELGELLGAADALPLNKRIISANRVSKIARAERAKDKYATYSLTIRHKSVRRKALPTF